MRISLGHLPFFAIEIVDPKTNEFNIWADNAQLEPATIAKLVIAMRAVADSWESTLKTEFPETAEALAQTPTLAEARVEAELGDRPHFGTLTALTVASPEMPSIASQCAEGHPFWEGIRTNSIAEAKESLRAHNYVIHGIGHA